MPMIDLSYNTWLYTHVYMPNIELHQTCAHMLSTYTHTSCHNAIMKFVLLLKKFKHHLEHLQSNPIVLFELSNQNTNPDTLKPTQMHCLSQLFSSFHHLLKSMPSHTQATKFPHHHWDHLYQDRKVAQANHCHLNNHNI